MGDDRDATTGQAVEDNSSFWLQLEIYIRENSGSTPSEAATALRRVAAKLEAGHKIGEISDQTGAEIGWFQAEVEGSAVELP